MKCLCGDVWPGCEPDSECLFYECGYEWCPKCDDHHRPPVCVTVIPAEAPGGSRFGAAEVREHVGQVLSLAVQGAREQVNVYDARPLLFNDPPWTPMRNRLPRGSRCYSLPSGAMVHVKPDCRC